MKQENLETETKKSGGFKVVTEEVPIAAEKETEVSSESTGSSQIMLSIGVKTIGGLLEMFTQIPEMNFTEEEVNQLVNVWSPFVTDVSPLATAIISTTLILGGKTAILVSAKRQKKIEVPNEEVTKSGDKSIDAQLKGS